MHRHRLSVLAFSSAILLGGAACSSSGGEATTVSTSPTTAATVTTVTGITVAPTTSVAPTTAAPTTEPATTTPATTSSTVPTIAATTPEAAARGLYAAWKAGDRTAAAAFGATAAIDSLFARPYTGPDLQFIGCEPDGDVFACAYYYEGGAETFRTKGSTEAGYQVIAITELAD